MSAFWFFSNKSGGSIIQRKRLNPPWTGKGRSVRRKREKL